MKKAAVPVTRGELKRDLQALENRIMKAFDVSLKETKLHFDMRTEQQTCDFRDIFNDRLETLRDARVNHEERLQRVEKFLRLV